MRHGNPDLSAYEKTRVGFPGGEADEPGEGGSRETSLLPQSFRTISMNSFDS
jgi:hypothetical protein